MKKLRFIFTLIFLAGMLFTVFQYVPLLEEETHTHKTEMAKKADSTGDGDSNSGLDDDDSEQELSYLCSSFSASFYCEADIHFSERTDLYTHLLESKDTPPPKI